VGEATAARPKGSSRFSAKTPPSLDCAAKRGRRQHWWTSHQWHLDFPAVYPGAALKNRTKGVQKADIFGSALPAASDYSIMVVGSCAQPGGPDGGVQVIREGGAWLANGVPWNTRRQKQGQLT